MKFTIKLLYCAVIFFLLPETILAKPSIGLSEAFWEFEPVKEGTILKKMLTIKNTGDETLSINLRPSCECVTVSQSEFSLIPLAKKNVEVKFNTKNYSGKKTEYLFIDSNDAQNKHINWLIEGEIISAGKPKVPEILVPVKEKFHKKIVLTIFDTPNCNYCLKLKGKIIPSISKKLNVEIEITEFAINDPKNYEKFIQIEKDLNDENNKLPVVVIGGKILGGRKEIQQNLEREIISSGDTPKESRSAKKETIFTTDNIKKKIDSLGMLTVSAAGFIDGLNPCAFAAIVFLIAYLSMIHKKSRPVVFSTGMMFILGTFVTYFLIGLGLSKFLGFINPGSTISKLIY
ncbi:MAG: DUF1573 domain-containing protein, partial [Elusimicrobiota bacterium]